MNSDLKRKEWAIDQIARSQFFHQKLHEWDLLGIANELESVKGEDLDWEEDLGITDKAWRRVIHKGIKPVRVFAHPEVLKQDSKRVGYYRMLTMVSLKSMGNIGLNLNRYEENGSELDDHKALEISRHLNKIVSILIEYDESLDTREFDLWRGMGAGSSAQGSWGNVKGDKVEVVIKDLIGRRVRDRGLVLEETSRGKSRTIELSDGRTLIFAAEPDVAVYRKRNKSIEMAMEIKGGIDPAAVLERFGATLKSLGRIRQADASSVTILMMQGVSLTPRAEKAIKDNRNTIDYFFKIEDVISDDDTRKRLFKIMKI